MLQAADFFHLPPRMASSGPGADRFQYRLSVEDEGRTHAVQIDEAAAPEHLRPLLDWLTNAARQSRGQ